MPDPLTLAVVGGSQIASAFIGAQATKSAAQQQTQMQQQALALNQANIERSLGLEQTAIPGAVSKLESAVGAGREALTGALAPFVSTGQQILPTLQQILTGGPEAQRMLESLPGFQFMQTQGQKAVTNQATMRGLGGNVLRGGAEYATGLAQSNWKNLVDSLFRTVEMGSTAGARLGTGLADVAMTGGRAMSDVMMGGTGKMVEALTSLGKTGAEITQNIGQTQAAATLGQAGQIQSGITNTAGLYGLSRMVGATRPTGQYSAPAAATAQSDWLGGLT